MSSLISRIKRDPVGFSVTPAGRLLTTLFRSVPSAYDTDQYKLTQKNKPIKIVFSGMGDSKLVSYAKDRFTQAYAGQPVYVFGHGQLQQALDFANKIPRNQPVQVFGYSWGSPTAMKFIDRYNGTINKAHYIDPMRHAVVDDAVIGNRKNIPTTYMTAGKYGGIRKLHDTLLAALRMKPAQGMVLLPQVKNHMALQQALKHIKQNQQQLQKSAAQREVIDMTYRDVYKMVKRAADKPAAVRGKYPITNLDYVRAAIGRQLNPVWQRPDQVLFDNVEGKWVPKTNISQQLLNRRVNRLALQGARYTKGPIQQIRFKNDLDREARRKRQQYYNKGTVTPHKPFKEGQTLPSGVKVTPENIKALNKLFDDVAYNNKAQTNYRYS